ncbi:uncharacterized protein BO66DRAFT_220642 [Aspergillus aculeatinus CBS 121060]|uniref:Uncharacterized protein n=1 Tax=Aspergillus aculeatinus CBS 121060 TaxID=1448322 RepID=A0ACD1HI96_9EURO|nr:hypothetical protein BO66DRAFT_220642 [Aspergillus aculeatinus CBS 121060]RAH73368.1 hypothetical protein BO66DRAFT_220642 [Aspergillus aculeatinus CBS 121060]
MSWSLRLLACLQCLFKLPLLPSSQPRFFSSLPLLPNTITRPVFIHLHPSSTDTTTISRRTQFVQCKHHLPWPLAGLDGGSHAMP